MSDLDEVAELLEADRETVQKERQEVSGSSLPEDWDESVLEEVEELQDELVDYFPSYSLPNGLKLQGSSRRGRYRGRDSQERPVVLAKVSRKIESVGHELGHDVFREVMPNLKGSTLHISTFKEMFADLTALHFTDIEPESRDLERDPRKDLSPYDGLSEALDTGVKDEELREIDRIENLLYQDNWGRSENYSLLQSKAWNLMELGPDLVETGRIQEHDDHRVKRAKYWGKMTGDDKWRENMFYSNLLREETSPRIQRIEQSKLDIWKMADVLKNREIGELKEPVTKAYESESRLGEKIRETADQMFRHPEKRLVRLQPEEILKETLSRELGRARGFIRSYRETLKGIDSRTDQVIRDISHLKYGSKSIENRHPGYEENISYPHNVGGKLAEELYDQGVEPSDLLEDPAEYLRKGAERIRSEIDRQV